MRNMKVLLCEPDLKWAEQMISQMVQYGMEVRAVREIEELWYPSGEIQGILVNRQELDSMLFWGEGTGRNGSSAGQSYHALHSLCEHGKKVVLILPDRDDDAECACLRAGAAECIHKKQPFDLMVQRILLAFREEMQNSILSFGEVQLDRRAGKLLCQEKQVRLTGMEQGILEILFVHGTDLTEKQEILQQVWGEQTAASRQRLDTLMKQIRRKTTGFPMGIYTCYGKGYYLVGE